MSLKDEMKALHRLREEVYLQAAHDTHRERLLRRALEALPICVLVKDDTGVVELADEKAAKLSLIPDATPGDVEGRSSFETWDPEDAAKYHKDDLEVLASGKMKQVLEHVESVDGDHTIITTMIPLQQERLVVKMVLDISDIAAKLGLTRAQLKEENGTP